MDLKEIKEIKNSNTTNFQPESNKDLNPDNLSTLSKPVYEKKEKLIDLTSKGNNGNNNHENKKEEELVFQETNFLLIDPKEKTEEIFRQYNLPENSGFKPFLMKLIKEWKTLKIDNNSLSKINADLNNDISNYKSEIYCMNQNLKFPKTTYPTLRNPKGYNQNGLLNKTNANINAEDKEKEDLAHIPSYPFKYNKPQKDAKKQGLLIPNNFQNKDKIFKEKKSTNAISEKNLKPFEPFIKNNPIPIPTKRDEIKNPQENHFDEYLARKLQQDEYRKLEHNNYFQNPTFENFLHIPKEDKIERGLKKIDIERILDQNNFNPSEISEKILCNICLCSYEKNRDFRKLKCNHWYHYECISKWLETKAKCPLCKCYLK